jgi:adenine deaminase
MVILNKLETVAVDTVIADGKVVSEHGNMVASLVSPTYPDFVRHSIHLRQLPSLIDLKIPTKTSGKSVRIRAIGVNPTTIFTHGLESETQVKNGEAIANPDEDLLKIAVLERHRATGNIGNAFVKGFGLKEGAFASTVAHDSHNLVVAGANATDMLAAIKLLVDSDGGLIAVNDGKSLAHVPLPIAGLMSDLSVEIVSKQIQELKEALSKMGCTLPAPYMTLAFTSLSVIPELRITDKGLLDTVNFKFVSPVIE